MLDKLFKPTEDDSAVLFDYDTAAEHTEKEFADIVAKHIGDSEVKEMKFAGDRKHRFLYFVADRRQFSFSYDRKKDMILFSELIKKQWKLHVGWRQL